MIQIAFVTDDLQASLDYWCGIMGAGPFFETRRVVDGTYMGKPSQPDINVMIGYWGDLQVELIKQHNDAPSIYHGWEGGPVLYNDFEDDPSSSDRKALRNASWKVRPIAIASPTDFICVVSVRSA